MSIIRLPIDIKSLYFNIKNDNETGHTATVSTPIRQGASIRPELAAINDVRETIDLSSREELISTIINKSRTSAKIDKVLVYSKITVNWIPIKTESSFCLYVREETDEANVHCGRLKLHYPPSLHFSNDRIEINNRDIAMAISEHLHNYAFLVEAFEIDTDTETLNFDVLIVGENNIPYSKVFINRRGVGNKFTGSFSEISDVYDMEILALREKLGYDNVSQTNFEEVYNANIEKAISMAAKKIKDLSGSNIRVLSHEYPYSLYDLQYSLDGSKNYVIVKQSATLQRYFNLSLAKIKFISNFSDNTELWFFSNIVDDNPSLKVYTNSDINNISKSISSITYFDKGGE